MASDSHATLTPDELTIYFASNRFNYSTTTNIYRASRLTRDAAFPTPIVVGSLASLEGEKNPAISADGNTIFYDSYRTNVGTVLLVSTRPNATVQFPAPTTISDKPLVEPSITRDGHMLYATNLGTGYLARLENIDGTWGPAQDVDTQLAYTQVSPATSDDLTLFMTLRGGALHVTKRAATTDPWPTPTEVTELDTRDEEVLPSWVSPDGCRLYMTYTPMGGKSRVIMTARAR